MASDKSSQLALWSRVDWEPNDVTAMSNAVVLCDFLV